METDAITFVFSNLVDRVQVRIPLVPAVSVILRATFALVMRMAIVQQANFATWRQTRISVSRPVVAITFSKRAKVVTTAIRRPVMVAMLFV